MAFRSDIEVDWSTSPRIILVKAPSTEVSIQDLVDTCRELEQQSHNLTYASLINAAGKENLGGGVLVGITAELQNAVVAFEPRLISDSSGTVTTADSTGTILTDNTATFISDGIIAGDTVYNETDGSVSSIIEVISETQIRTYPLEDGVDNQYDLTDSYKIWNKIQCSIDGGNLVAIDDIGSSISALLPTAHTHVVRTASSSATLQEQAAIQYASFDGGVWLDATSGNIGTTYPVGTPEFPVNNATDARTIANNRGFSKIYVVGDYTFASGENISLFDIIGQDPSRTTLTFDPGSIVAGAEFFNSTVQGTMASPTGFSNCHFKTVTGATIGLVGEMNIENCKFNETITLSASLEGQINLINCNSGVAAPATPIFDMNGADVDIIVRNYYGGMEIRGVSHVNNPSLSMDMGSGNVILDSTCTTGNITIRGLSLLTDNSNGSTVNTSGLIFSDQLQLAAFEGGIWIDPIAGTTGTKFPKGTAQDPVNNLTDAVSISMARGFDKFYVSNTLVVGPADDISGYVLEGTNPLSSTVFLSSGCTTANTRFTDMNITGVINGGIFVERCAVINLSNIGSDTDPSLFNNCIFIQSTITFRNGLTTPQNIQILNCSSGVNSGVGSTFNFNGTNTFIGIRNFTGNLSVTNFTGGQECDFYFSQGQLTLDATCTSGTAHIAGIVEVADNSVGLTSNKRAQVSLSNLSPASIGSLEELIKGDVDGLDYREVSLALIAVLAGKQVKTNNAPGDDTVEYKAQDDVTTHVTGRIVNGVRTEADVNEENM